MHINLSVSQIQDVHTTRTILEGGVDLDVGAELVHLADRDLIGDELPKSKTKKQCTRLNFQKKQTSVRGRS